MKSEKSDGTRPSLLRSLPSDSFFSEKPLKTTDHTRSQVNFAHDVLCKTQNTLEIQELAQKLHIAATKLNLSALRYALSFQLPLKKETLEQNMKQVLKLPLQYQEAGLFSTILALSKGLKLSDETLGQVARLFTTYTKGETQAKGTNHKSPAVHQYKTSLKDTNHEIEPSESEQHQELPLTPGQTALYFSEASRTHPAIDFLNRLTDRNNQHYLVIPFQFSEASFVLQGTLRLFCIDRPGGIVDVPQLVIEAVTQKHQWYVQALKNDAGGLALNLRVYPPPKNSETLVNALTSVSDTVSISFEKSESFSEFRETGYTSFEIQA
ncbi:hypothetical protein [Gracilinema caldarium]|uniref:Uncharacterized protein n=1 Tax=Gracilinema caldarium (strain ATCC 51460 / DSM 7334 / H1) TaxID=744872 RepID=F8EZZ5_GRAC1|nr:hypothetical protein [Gracilinema caldarium]AEJ18648.1 hypothetical protein Spica_0484 [Gracilinema caldarium DSM 7334]